MSEFQWGGDDTCLSMFAGSPWRQMFPPHARVLEIGCAEADWLGPMHTERPDLALRGIDVRALMFPHDGVTILQGDVLTHDFEPDSLDVVVLVSALEHIGLGHYGDPLDPAGDDRCLGRVHRWLAPGGRLYFDVPWHTGDYRVQDTSYRLYNDPSLAWRLRLGREWIETWRAYADAGGTYVTRPEHAIDLDGGNPKHYVACWWQKA